MLVVSVKLMIKILDVFVLPDQGDDVTRLVQFTNIDCVFYAISILGDIVRKSKVDYQIFGKVCGTTYLTEYLGGGKSEEGESDGSIIGTGDGDADMSGVSGPSVAEL